MSKTSNVSAPGLWIVLSRCQRALALRIEGNIADLGLCLTDFMVLEALLHKGPLTISAIQSKVLLASGSMTAAIDRLENRALLVRKMTSQDRRARVLELTPRGRGLIAGAYGEHAQFLEEAMSALSANEKQQLYAGLKKLGLAVSGKEENEQANTGDSPRHGNRR